MKTIQIESWPRRKHYEVYKNFDSPHFNITANLDVTRFYEVKDQINSTFTIAVTYLLSLVANQITEFRYRIRGDEVVLHDAVHPSITILTGDNLFGFCTFEFTPDWKEFSIHAAEQIEFMKSNPTLKDEAGQDDLLFMTTIPWISFTSFVHPMHYSPVDSIPRFAWGKTFEVDGGWRMPLSVQAHHALVDGVHVGSYFNKLQTLADSPDEVFLI